METELINKIQQTRQELFNLNSEYAGIMQEKEKKILKTKGFDKVLYLLNQNFESSSSRTPQYLQFHRIFKKEFKEILRPLCSEIEISKPNHFDISGFFKLNDERIFYFSISDLRWSKDKMLIRTAKDFKDYSGGSNGFLNLNESFVDNLLNYLKRP